MGAIGVTYAELEELRSRLNQGSTQITDRLNQLVRDLGPLRESSAGSYIQAFDERKAKWDRDMTNLSNVLNQAATQLGNFGQRMQEADAAGAKAFSAI